MLTVRICRHNSGKAGEIKISVIKPCFKRPALAEVERMMQDMTALHLRQFFKNIAAFWSAAVIDNNDVAEAELYQ